MSYYTADKAVGRRAADPLDPVLNPAAPQDASRQVRFTKPDEKAMTTQPVGNQLKVQANTKGTGRENVESSIALAPKRRLNVKLPANY